MMGLKENDEVNWKYLKDNFSINKTGIPFCSIVSDHALEQDKVLKVNGGVVGLKHRILQLYTDFALYRLCVHNFEEFWNRQIYRTQISSAGRLNKSTDISKCFKSY